MQQRYSKLSKDFMGICSRVALLHFVLVNSIFFLLLEMQVPGWDICWFQLLCPGEGIHWAVSSHGLHLVYPLAPSAAVCGPLLSQVLLSIFLRSVHISVPNQRQKPRALFHGFCRRGKIELFLVDILIRWACGSSCWISCQACAASYRCRQAWKSNWKSC